MQIKKTTNRSYLVSSGEKRHGFTLVEFIVILAIVAILAASGVIVAIGYINKSKFDQNSQNAVTVYQTAQTALAHKTDDGSIHKWVETTVFLGEGGFTDADFKVNGSDVLKETNESIHKTVFLTFNPGSSDNALYNLLDGYFYDATIFAGTISVEFDISATLQNDGSKSYSATVLSAFYSKENKATSGWDSKCSDGATDGLPQRDYDHRRHTSFVGYYNGTQTSLVGPVPVALPNQQLSENMLFTLRNGETLDVTWAVFDNTQHNGNFTITLKNEDDFLADSVELKINENAILYSWKSGTPNQPIELRNHLPANSPHCYVDPDEYITYEYVNYNGNQLKIKKTSKEVLAAVEYQGTEYLVPLRVSWVEGDTREGYPALGYNTYSLLLDCMMIRSDYELDPQSADLFSICRFFGNNPTNISATFEGNASGMSIAETHATRAIDDPVYYDGVLLETWKVADVDFPQATYIYNVTGKGARDTDEKCVVNTLFGDAVYSEGSIEGTSFDSYNTLNAVITSYRHLSNIRLISSDTVAKFIIIRDLDWYVKVGQGHCASEVREYKCYYNGRTRPYNGENRAAKGYPDKVMSRSPVSEGTVKIVSFPALPKLCSSHTLTSLPHKEGDKLVDSKISNVQLRIRSFVKNSDNAYGLICENEGTVYNIYTNNLSLVISNVNNGGDNDYSGGTSLDNCINPAVDDVTIQEGKSGTYNMDLPNKPVGGLIGLNKGNVGVDGIEDSMNTVRSDNSVVMAGKYWVFMWFNDGVGGIVGKNTGNVHGAMELNGNFAVLGQDKVGGIIGYSTTAVDSKFVVNNPDSTVGASEFKFPVESRTGKEMSCVIATKYTCGGVIGQIENAAFSSDVSASVDENTNVITYSGSYQIQANLSENSLIYLACDRGNNTNTRFGGGAIGYMKNCSGKLSVNLTNNGDIVLYDIDRQFKSYCGGVVGFEENCSNDIYVNAEYGKDTRIGSFSDSDSIDVLPDCAGGAYGYFENKSADRTIAINVVSGATISARFSADSYGAGGAVGGIKSTVDFAHLYINVNNSGKIYGKPTDTDTAKDGTGGAIGSFIGGKNANSRIRVVSSGDIKGARYVGGAFGYNNMQNTSIIVVSSGTIEGNDYVGGAFGYTDQKTNTFDVTSSGTIEGDDYVGGVIGLNDAAFDNAKSTLNGCSIEGHYVGGLIGRNNAVFANATVDASGNTRISGSDYTGGAIGYNNNSISGAINVYLSDSVRISGENYTGGVFGYTGNGSIGSIKAAYSITGTEPLIKGDMYVGGVIGYNDSPIGASASDIVLDSEISGQVIGTEDYVGGVIGYNNAVITGQIKASISGTVSGANNIGGVIGINKAQISGNVSADFSGDAAVFGTKNIGGAIGCNNAVIPSEVSVSSSSGSLTIGNKDNPGDNIGGNIGNSLASVSALSTNFTGSVILYGADNVGGAVGNLEGSLTSNSSVIAVLGSGSEIRGNENVGGAVGNTIIQLSAVSATFNGDGKVIGSTYTGGAIGKTNQDITGTISVLFNGKATIGNSDNAGDYIGGVIGNSEKTVGGISAEFKDDVDIYGDEYVGGVVGNLVGTLTSKAVSVSVGGSGKIYGTTYVGGAIGYNNISLNSVAVEISGDGVVVGTSSIGGAIGNNQVSVSGTVSTSIGGNAIIGDEDNPGNNVGGVIGYSKAEVGGISASFGSDLDLYGVDYVGGAVGNLVSKLTSNKSISVPIGGNLTIHAGSYVGGVIGYTGTKELQNISVSVGGSTNIICSGGYIGGAIGRHDNGNTNETRKLNGVVSANYTGAVTVSGNGDYIGGVIGNSYMDIVGIAVTYGSDAYISGDEYVGGMAGYLKGGVDNKNITMPVAGDFTLIGTNYVGGAFGVNAATLTSVTITYSGTADISGEKFVGGAVGRNEKKNAGNPVSFNIQYVGAAEISGIEQVGGAIGCDVGTVKTVTISANSIDITANKKVGGAIGIVDGSSVSGGINMTLKASHIGGIQEVGGAIGVLTNATFSGGMNLNFTEGTYIGDRKDADEYRCVDVGGAIGYFTSNSKMNNGRLVINIDETSMIYAGGTDYSISDLTIEEAGVGGAFGRLGASGGGTTPGLEMGNVKVAEEGAIEVNSSSYDVTIYSARSIVGGVVGHMLSGKIIRSYSTAVVSGYNYVGGFVGKMDNGQIKNSYVGGHTKYGGYYVTGEENVTGIEWVGGFAGYISKDTKGDDNNFTQNYSTASVRGTAHVGGFAGFLGGTNKILGTYCTGLVSLNPGGDSNTVGAFVGEIDDITAFKSDSDGNGNGNKVLLYVNDPDMRRIGSIAGVPSDDSTIPKTRLRWAHWGNVPETLPSGLYKNDYIRTNPKSTYAAYPFDPELDAGEPEEGKFPLRTFVSTNYEPYFGIHHGDWPVVMTEDTKLLTNANTIIEFVDEDDNVISDVFTYVIGGVQPKVRVTYAGPTGTTVLTTDNIRIDYTNNNKIGVATVVVSGKGEYGRSVSKNFTIEALDISSATVTVSEQIYTGAEIKPEITLSLVDGENVQIIPVTDYTVTYTDNTNVGTATIKIKPDPDKYTVNASEDGMITATFEIKPIEINSTNTTVILSENPIYYTGSAVQPVIDKITVVSGENTLELTPGDYSAVCTDENVGPGKLTISGVGNFQGDIEIDINIVTADNEWTTEPSIADWTVGETPATPDIGESKFGGDTRVIKYYSDENCADEDEIADISAATEGTYYMKVVVPEDDSEYHNYNELEIVISFEIKAADPSQGGSGSGEGGSESGGEGGTTTDPQTGGEGGTTTDPQTGGEGGTTTDPQTGGEGGDTTNPQIGGEGGETTDPQTGGEGGTDPQTGGESGGDQGGDSGSGDEGGSDTDDDDD